MTGQGGGPGQDLDAVLGARWAEMWATLAGIGRDDAGGFSRLAWTGADAQLRQWFRTEASRRDMAVEQDGNGNMWAWWGAPGPGAVATGSHLDSVPNGGAFDGPLGIVSGFMAVDELQAKARPPQRPVAVVCFSDEEGARFGVACVGSRLICGALGPGAARALVDVDGLTLAQAMQGAGADPARLGPAPERLAWLRAFVEVHIEQGRALVDLGAPIGLATGIWPHGRWRCSFQGEPNHAGTTLMSDRRDPMVPLAMAIIEARRAAEHYGARATIAKTVVGPNATNAVAARADGWLDARAADEQTLQLLVDAVHDAARRGAAAHDVGFQLTRESYTGAVEFDVALRAEIAEVLGGPPEVATAAGHDSGILSGHVPTAMIFVRNPTGVSHSPAESAAADDCRAGAHALAQVIEALSAR